MSWSDLNWSSPELFICCSTVLLNFWCTLHLGLLSLGGDSRRVLMWYKLTELFAQISVFSFPEEVPKCHLTYSGVGSWCQVQELLLYFAFSCIPDFKLPLRSPLLPLAMAPSLPSGCQGDWVSLMQMLSLGSLPSLSRRQTGVFTFPRILRTPGCSSACPGSFSPFWADLL